MTQRDLFGEPGLEPKQRAVAREKREQETQLRRVHGTLGDIILAFCAERWSKPDGVEFHMEELLAYVRRRAPTAPGSPDRVLRLLRQDGHLNYRVVNRSTSLYRLLEVPHE